MNKRKVYPDGLNTHLLALSIISDFLYTLCILQVPKAWEPVSSHPLPIGFWCIFCSHARFWRKPLSLWSVEPRVWADMRFCMTTPVGGTLGSCDLLLQASLTFALAGLPMITKLLLPSVKASPTWNTCHGFSVEFWFTCFIFSKVILDLFSHDKNDQVLTLLSTKHQDYNYQVGFYPVHFKTKIKNWRIS